MTNHQEKLDELNQEGKSVWDSIDRPIRNLVLHLNRVGLRTRFSCCGFPYNQEEEPKSHSHFPFIVIQSPFSAESEGQALQELIVIQRLAALVDGTSWILENYRCGQWYLSCRAHQEVITTFYRKPAGDVGLHDYETPLIAIQSLAKKLQGFPSASTEFTIVDGNSIYEEGTGGEWQVKPKKSITFRLGVRVDDNEQEEESGVGGVAGLTADYVPDHPAVYQLPSSG